MGYWKEAKEWIEGIGGLGVAQRLAECGDVAISCLKLGEHNDAPMDVMKEITVLKQANRDLEIALKLSKAAWRVERDRSTNLEKIFCMEGPYVKCEDGSVINQVSTQRLGEVYDEIQNHRKFLEIHCPPDDGFCEDFDSLIDLKLITEVKPTPEFIDEWGDDTRMYIYTWHLDDFEPVEDDDGLRTEG